MPLVSKAFGDIITFTRASTGTYFDSAGVLQSAAVDQPRFDYDPSTLAAQGFLIEEARTNSIRNNTMVGGGAGVAPTNWSIPGVSLGITIGVVDVGTEDGISYIDLSLSGTASGSGTVGAVSFEITTSATATQVWTESLYAKFISGTLPTLNIRFNWRDGGGASITSTDSSALPVTNSKLSSQRYQFSATAPALTATVWAQLRFGVTSGIDYTGTVIRVGLPQLELGAFATSVIPTTTTALTRSADVASVNPLNPWYNATEGTLFVEASPQVSNVAGFNLAELNDATASNRMGLFKLATTGNASLAVLVSGATQASTNSGAWTATGKLAGAYKLDDFASSLNGSAAATDTLGTIPTVTQLTLGRRGDGANLLNGHLRRIVYYPRRLSNAELQSITS